MYYYEVRSLGRWLPQSSVGKPQMYKGRLGVVGEPGKMLRFKPIEVSAEYADLSLDGLWLAYSPDCPRLPEKDVLRGDVPKYKAPPPAPIM